jgi:hypothetical protein
MQVLELERPQGTALDTQLFEDKHRPWTLALLTATLALSYLDRQACFLEEGKSRFHSRCSLSAGSEQPI